MPKADIPYVIGVIREKEKELLEDDEYVRVVEAPSLSQAYQALSDTPYGIFLAQHSNIDEALSKRLLTEYDWLKEMIGEQHPLITFISARYDALHISRAQIDLPTTTHYTSSEKRIGTMSDELLTATLWHKTAYDSVPEEWRAFLQEQPTHQASKTEIIDHVQAHLMTVMEKLATTPLTQKLTQLESDRLTHEKTIRPNNIPDNPSEYELEWDKRMLDVIRPWRADPISSDAIVAWWYALVLEVKGLRLLLSAKASGFPPARLHTLVRPVYLATV